MSRNITESFQIYKGYTIRLRAVQGNGFWYSIIKYVPNKSSPDGIKALYLRKIGFVFIEPDELLQKAKNYIDSYPNVLEAKFQKLKTNLNQK
jgi:hypothetical protein